MAQIYDPQTIIEISVHKHKNLHHFETKEQIYALYIDTDLSKL
jgi:hypothetical protein